MLGRVSTMALIAFAAVVVANRVEFFRMITGPGSR